MPDIEQQSPRSLDRALGVGGTVLVTLSSVTPTASVVVIVPVMITAIGGASLTAMVAAVPLCVAMAMCYAELASALPVAGGEYSYAARILGTSVGRGVLLTDTLGVALVLAALAQGAGQFVAVASGFSHVRLLAVLFLVLGCVVAVLKVRLGARITGTCLALEVVALVALSVLGLLHVSRSLGDVLVLSPTPGGLVGGAARGLFVAQLATAVFAFNGYGSAVFLAEETRGAGRSVARAVFWALGATTVTEILPLACVLLGSPSLSALASSGSPIDYFLRARGGVAVDRAFALVVAVAIVNAVIAVTIQGGRILYCAARDRSLPRPLTERLARVHATTRTPVLATLGLSAAAMVSAAVIPPRLIVVATGATLLVPNIAVAVCAIVGRTGGATSHATFRMRGWPVVPVVALIALLGIAVQLWRTSPVQVVLPLLLLAAGSLSSALGARRAASRRST